MSSSPGLNFPKLTTIENKSDNYYFILTLRFSIFSIFCFFSGFIISCWFFSRCKFLNLETPARFEAPNSERQSMSHPTFIIRDYSIQNRCFESCEKPREEIRIKILTEILISIKFQNHEIFINNSENVSTCVRPLALYDFEFAIVLRNGWWKIFRDQDRSKMGTLSNNFYEWNFLEVQIGHSWSNFQEATKDSWICLGMNHHIGI